MARSTETVNDDGLELIERNAESAALRAAVEAAGSGQGRIVLLEGDPGMGKTSLLAGAHAHARGRDVRLLSARGSVLERDFPFGVLAELLRPIDPAIVAAAPAPLRGLLSGAAAEAIEPSRLLFDGILRLVEAVAEDRPVVLSVDDAQWVDRESLLAIAYIGHRIESLGAVLLVARRTPPRGPTVDDRADLQALAPLLGAGATRLVLRPLSRAGVMALAFRYDLDGPDADGDLLYPLTKGNPLLVEHIVARLAAAHSRSNGGAPTATAVGEIVLERLRLASPEAQAVAQAVSILGDGAALPVVAQLARLVPERSLAAASELESSGIFRHDAAFSFVHPLLPEALREQLGEHARGLLHHRAAGILRDCGVEPAQIAGQLLRAPATGDPAAVADLRAAADLARRRASPQAAATLLRRALEEGPSDPDVEVELGLAELAGGLVGDALPRLELAIGDGRFPAEVVLLAAIGQIMERGFVGAVNTLLRGADARASANPDDALLLRGAAAYTAWFLPPPERPKIELPPDRPPAGQTRGERMALTGLLAQRAADPSFTAHEAISLARAALAGGQLARDHAVAAEFAVSPLLCLLYAEDLDAAAREIRESELTAWEHAWPGALVLARIPGVLLLYSQGELAAAIAEGEALLELVPQLTGPLRGWIGGMLAGLTVLSVLAHEGADAADAALERLQLTEELSPELLFATIARVHVHLASGRADAAVADARAFDLAHRMIGAPESIIEAHTALPLALLAAGEHEAAKATFDAELARAERWGSPGRIAALKRVGARIEPGTAVERLGHAVTLLDASPLRLERARALLELGAALRRSGRRADARARLQAAIQIAVECGAQPVVTAALEELRVLGARPRRLAFSGVDALTASEQRVAQLAAAGATNREIAERLFITAKTVDSHLTRAYRKLGIGSRHELAGALRPALSPPPTRAPEHPPGAPSAPSAGQ